MAHWEYKVALLTAEVHRRRMMGDEAVHDSIAAILNEYGEQGWELVSLLRATSRGSSNYIGVLKRQLNS